MLSRVIAKNVGDVFFETQCRCRAGPMILIKIFHNFSLTYDAKTIRNKTKMHNTKISVHDKTLFFHNINSSILTFLKNLYLWSFPREYFFHQHVSRNLKL